MSAQMARPPSWRVHRKRQSAVQGDLDAKALQTALNEVIAPPTAAPVL